MLSQTLMSPVVFASSHCEKCSDFLNNAGKTGMLEVEAGRLRISFYLSDGRVQPSPGMASNPDDILSTLPESLRDLGPVLKLTVSGRSCSEVDGLVELLDRKVLDPRLLRSLLRFQAAMLIWSCFRNELKSFRFEAGRVAAPLFQKLPLDASLASLLVEAAQHCPADDLDPETVDTFYSRRAVRGQNLDRAGLSAVHMKLLTSRG